MQVTINNTYGAALVGCIFAAFFYGITCVQICFYNITFPNESKILRSLVNILWILDTLHLSCVISTMYFFLITSRNTAVWGTTATWTDGALIILSHLSDCLVRCIFIHRICHLIGRRFLVISAFGTLTLVSAGFGIFYGVLAVSHPPSVLAAQTLSFIVYAGLATSAATDIAISTTLCCFFNQMAHEVESAHPLLNKLRFFAIQAGVLPSVVALTSLITYAIYPRTFMYMGVFFVLPKATLNSMLAMLNARKTLRRVLPLKSAKVPTIRLSVESPEIGSVKPSLPEVMSPSRRARFEHLAV